MSKSEPPLERYLKALIRPATAFIAAVAIALLAFCVWKLGIRLRENEAQSSALAVELKALKAHVDLSNLAALDCFKKQMTLNEIIMNTIEGGGATRSLGRPKL